MTKQLTLATFTGRPKTVFVVCHSFVGGTLEVVKVFSDFDKAYTYIFDEAEPFEVEYSQKENSWTGFCGNTFEIQEWFVE